MNQRVVIGRLEDFPEGSWQILEIDGQSVGVYNRQGELYAVRNLCPHQLAPICLGTIGGTMLPASRPGEYVYGLEGYVLRCVAHGWEFDIRTGESVFGADQRKLATFPVEVQGDQVSITMRVRATQPPANPN